MPKHFQILKEMVMDICGYTSMSIKKQICMRSLGLWGNQHRKGGVMKEKGDGKRREKKSIKGEIK